MRIKVGLHLLLQRQQQPLQLPGVIQLRQRLHASFPTGAAGLAVDCRMRIGSAARHRQATAAIFVAPPGAPAPPACMHARDRLHAAVDDAGMEKSYAFRLGVSSSLCSFLEASPLPWPACIVRGL